MADEEKVKGKTAGPELDDEVLEDVSGGVADESNNNNNNEQTAE